MVKFKKKKTFRKRVLFKLDACKNKRIFEEFLGKNSKNVFFFVKKVYASKIPVWRKKNLQRIQREGSLKGNSCLMCILKSEKCLYTEGSV